MMLAIYFTSSVTILHIPHSLKNSDCVCLPILIHHYHVSRETGLNPEASLDWSKSVVPKRQCASRSPVGLVTLLGSTPTISGLTGLDAVRAFASGDADTAGLTTTL